MTRIDFGALRLRCQFAFEAYKSRAASVLESSKHGEVPPTAELRAEEVALYEYAKVRPEMLDALSTSIGRPVTKPARCVRSGHWPTRMRAMPWSDDETRALRLRYNAAQAAHADAARALTEAFIRGDVPTDDLLESERQAKSVLDGARRNLHEAMSRAIRGDAEPSA